MRRLLLNETSVPVKDRLIPILEYDGLPVTARKIAGMIRNFITLGNVTPITRRAQAEEISALTYIKPAFRHPKAPVNDLGWTRQDYEGGLSTLCAAAGTIPLARPSWMPASS